MTRPALTGAVIAVLGLVVLGAAWACWPIGDGDSDGGRAASAPTATAPAGPAAEELDRLAESLASADPALVFSAIVVPVGAEPNPELAAELAAMSDVEFDASSFEPADGEPDMGTVTVSWRDPAGAEHAQDLLLIRQDGQWRVLAAVTAP